MRSAPAVFVCWLPLLAGLLGTKCDEQTDPVWVQYNSSDDVVDIEVGVEEELDPVGTDLHSSVTELVIGRATVTPGGGPIGTIHSLLVIVDDTWENDVGRVSVRTDSGDRGKDEYELISDPADEGYWGLDLESVGSEGEQRTDTLTFRLWYDSQESEATDDTGA